jgi:hypothetical protein
MSDLDVDIMFLKLFRRKLMQFQCSRLVLRKRSIPLKFIWNAHLASLHDSSQRKDLKAQQSLNGVRRTW